MNEKDEKIDKHADTLVSLFRAVEQITWILDIWGDELPNGVLLRLKSAKAEILQAYTIGGGAMNIEAIQEEVRAIRAREAKA